MHDDRPDDDAPHAGLFDDPAPDAGSGRGRKRPVQTPVQRALGLLVRREHSRRELTRKLVARGLEAGEVAAAVDRLTDEGWQDDARFAESLVRQRAASGYGPIHIRAELGTHGLDGDAIAAALDTFEGDWTGNARELVQRRYGPDLADDPARRRKAAELLMRRGFPGDVVRAATRFDED